VWDCVVVATVGIDPHVENSLQSNEIPVNLCMGILIIGCLHTLDTLNIVHWGKLIVETLQGIEEAHVQYVEVRRVSWLYLELYLSSHT
jgi:hypothetical protein